MFNDHAVDDCAPLARLQHWRVAQSGCRGQMENHYVAKSEAASPSAAHWRFSRLHEPVPQYDAFWNGNKTFCREVVGCLFGADVALFECAPAASRRCAPSAPVRLRACVRQGARTAPRCVRT